MNVIDNAASRRFEVTVDGHTAFLDYETRGQVLALLHAETPSPIQGRGIAGEVTRFAMEYAREHGLRVLPLCGYVRAWLRDNPEYADRLAA